jgi:hypothetical protein
MAFLSLDELVMQRAAVLAQSHPDLRIVWMIGEDNALISSLRGEVIVGFEYLETERSWDRPERKRFIEEAIGKGIPVTVIVPEVGFLETHRRLEQLGGEGTKVLFYDYMGISSVLRPS